jgi:hypothetical protein
MKRKRTMMFHILFGRVWVEDDGSDNDFPLDVFDLHGSFINCYRRDGKEFSTSTFPVLYPLEG